MDNQQNQKHTKAIYRMLLEMVNGQLGYRIALDATDKQFNEVAVLLNEAAEKIQQSNYLNPYHNFLNPFLSGNDAATAII